jgi:hypothetical protein
MPLIPVGKEIASLSMKDLKPIMEIFLIFIQASPARDDAKSRCLHFYQFLE